MPLKRYIVTIVDPRIWYTLVSVEKNTTTAVVSLQILGGEEGGSLTLATLVQPDNASVHESDRVLTVAANDVLVIDDRQFLEYGDTMAISGSAGMTVVANCVVQAASPAPVPPSPLPEGYTELACLKLKGTSDAGQSGKSSIDTGVDVAASYSYEVDFAVDERWAGTGTTTYAVFGAKHQQSKGQGVALWILPKDRTLNFVNGGPTAESGYQSYGSIAYGTYFTVICDSPNGTLSVNGTQIGTAAWAAPTATPATITLFAQHNLAQNSTSGEAPVKIKRFRVYSSGMLLYDFLPCMRGSDSKLGFYDIVGDKGFRPETVKGGLTYESIE